MDFDRSVFFAEAKEAGMLCVATDGGGDFDVDYTQPGMLTANGQWTHEHRIEYQNADRPNLAEGDVLSIVDADSNAVGTFRVRMRPFVDAPGNAADGYFRIAILTKQ